MRSILQHVWDRGKGCRAAILLVVLLAAFIQCQVPALAVDDDEPGCPLSPNLESSILPPATFQLTILGPAGWPQPRALLTIGLGDLVGRGPASLRSPPPDA
jgi:hypothetical protein